MIALAWVGILCSALVQDEPGVSYREGLYQEIDLGNLEKALDLYGRVLKSTAEPALKARSLFRQGYCLEKLGRKKDAEQAYRDVGERFGDQADVAKLARGRLAALSGTAASPGASLEGEIQQLILDLGSGDLREKAIGRLTLIGNAAVPDLKRALGHKDVSLAVGAARVLLHLEQYEGLYDVFTRAQTEADLREFGTFLDHHREDRERLVADSATLSPYALYVILAFAPHFESARIAGTIEERILRQEDGRAELVRAWWSAAELARLPGFVERLIAGEKDPKRPRLFTLLNGRMIDTSSQPFFQTLSGELERGLQDLVDPTQEWLRVLAFYMTPKSLVTGLLGTWLKRDDLELRDRVLRFSSGFFINTLSVGIKNTFGTAYEDFVFDVLGSAEFSDDLRKSLFLESRMRGWQTNAQGERQAKVLQFCRDYIKKFGLIQGDKDQVSQLARESLIVLLPEDSPDWALVFDQDMRIYSPEQSIWETLAKKLRSSERLRKLYVEAAFRALSADSPTVPLRGIHQYESFANPRERRDLAKTIPSLSGDRLLGEAARALRSGFDPLSLEERARELGEIRPLFKSPTLALRQSLTYEFKVFHDASIAEIMKEALRDSDVQVRRRAVEHWTLVRAPESIPLLIEALRDPDDIVKGSAIIALRGAPSLDAVPPLIEFLHASRSDLRTNAQETLKAIQQYFEEQEQWRKWYEEMKQRTAPRKEK